MNRFAELLDRLAYEPGRNNKLRLMTDYFRHTPDPERGYALAALTGNLVFQHAKPGMIRALISERTDPLLFALSRDFVGDTSETVALMWPAPASSFPSPLEGEGGEEQSDEPGGGSFSKRTSASLASPPSRRARSQVHAGCVNLPAMRVDLPLKGGGEKLGLTEVVTTLNTLGKSELPAQIARWLDALDETGRWALLKLVMGALRVGVSARLAKTAAAALGDKDVTEIELMWSGLEPPYSDLFAWLEGRGDKPSTQDPAPFRPAMLAQAIEDSDFEKLDPAEFLAEWKWDGIRVQAAAGVNERGERIVRMYSRTGEDISRSFPELLESLNFNGSLDGELLILREHRVQSFNVLQQRLNRKVVTPKLVAEFPAHLRAYDLLVDGSEDLRELPFEKRRKRLQAFVARHQHPRLDLSPLVPFATWPELAAARADPVSAGAGEDADAVEGIMLKRRDAPYVPGRPKGLWWKWKRDPFTVDAVLMYAQRGSGKRSSYYSDYTFGVWTEIDGADNLVPVGKAYFGFTDEELLKIDRYVRNNTVERFGPVRAVKYGPDEGLVLEVAFEGLQRSTRHKSGIAMRFPRISRLRWDKPPREADRLETLEKMLQESGRLRAGLQPAAP